jgi:hypothetical protein
MGAKKKTKFALRQNAMSHLAARTLHSAILAAH